MAQFLGFGNGSDGVATLSGTDAPIDSACSGTAASTSLTATNASFAAGQMILIHQTRKASGAGTWEINQIAGYTAGTITTTIPLSYSYSSASNDKAQVSVLKQYSGVTVSSTLTAKAWGGTVGSILGFMCSGKVSISATISANAKGGRGGDAVAATNNGKAGEGYVLASVTGSGANSSGGGGGTYQYDSPGDGGGGGHSSAGGNGSNNSATGGTGGLSCASADLTTMLYGGGGGGGGAWHGGSSGAGGTGGGIIAIFANEIVLADGTGLIRANGGNGTAAPDGLHRGNGGGGAGGSIILKTKTAYLGNVAGQVAASGGVGASQGGSGSGGAGSTGRIRIEACSVSGTSAPSYSYPSTALNYCSTKKAILEG